jgi:hypothetical protein
MEEPSGGTKGEADHRVSMLKVVVSRRKDTSILSSTRDLARSLNFGKSKGVLKPSPLSSKREKSLRSNGHMVITCD